jgi:hypothetical protein
MRATKIKRDRRERFRKRRNIISVVRDYNSDDEILFLACLDAQKIARADLAADRTSIVNWCGAAQI